MTKKKNDESNDCAECNFRSLENVLTTFSILADQIGWRGEEDSDPEDAISAMAYLEEEYGMERSVRGAYGVLRDYEQLVRRNR